MKSSFPAKGEVWLVSLQQGVGHEQTGSRPALVLAGVEQLGLLSVVPFTSNLSAADYPHTCKIVPSKLNGLSVESVAMAFQIQSVHELRFLRKAGVLSSEDFKAIAAIVSNYLGI